MSPVSCSWIRGRRACRPVGWRHCRRSPPTSRMRWPASARSSRSSRPTRRSTTSISIADERRAGDRGAGCPRAAVRRSPGHRAERRLASTMAGPRCRRTWPRPSATSGTPASRNWPMSRRRDRSSRCPTSGTTSRSRIRRWSSQPSSRSWRRSSRHSDSAWNGDGPPGGIRTPDLLIRSQTLYPLSYGRTRPDDTASVARSGTSWRSSHSPGSSRGRMQAATPSRAMTSAGMGWDRK